MRYKYTMKMICLMKSNNVINYLVISIRLHQLHFAPKYQQLVAL